MGEKLQDVNRFKKQVISEREKGTPRDAAYIYYDYIKFMKCDYAYFNLNNNGMGGGTQPATMHEENTACCACPWQASPPLPLFLTQGLIGWSNREPALPLHGINE
jgi:hypothetical protein